jgi:hypothetical protein
MKTIATFFLFVILTHNGMAKELTTQILIQASPEKVWSILTYFKDYPNWNPFIKSITHKKDIAVGNKIKAKIDGMTFKPKILTYDINQEFRWIGHLFFTGLFDGEHRFQLIDNSDGTTTFIQSEVFKGILVPLFNKKLGTDTKAGFEAMNAALKIEAEK